MASVIDNCCIDPPIPTPKLFDAMFQVLMQNDEAGEVHLYLVDVTKPRTMLPQIFLFSFLPG